MSSLNLFSGGLTVWPQDVVSSVNCFHNIFTTEAVGSHNYQCTYSVLFDLQGELLFPLTDVPVFIPPWNKVTKDECVRENDSNYELTMAVEIIWDKTNMITMRITMAVEIYISRY